MARCDRPSQAGFTTSSGGGVPGVHEEGVGETLHTEHSHKFSVAGFQALAARAGFRAGPVWQDAREWFALLWLQAPAA